MFFQLFPWRRKVIIFVPLFVVEHGKVRLEKNASRARSTKAFRLIQHIPNHGISISEQGSELVGKKKTGTSRACTFFWQHVLSYVGKTAAG